MEGILGTEHLYRSKKKKKRLLYILCLCEWMTLNTNMANSAKFISIDLAGF